jgi:hypothetical protein
VPYPQRIIRVNLQEVNARNENARSIVSGFSEALPALAHFWEQIEASLADTSALATELTDTRLFYANLLAAGRASIAAQLDGEDDPLSYLRDEIFVQGHGRGA